jgi:cellulose synthase/poly-beta-1,6-N-acetylglucosamine synthase-like glycosyltransferase
MLVRHVRFTLGACNGVKADDVRAIGGWETLGGELAEDQRLGALLADSGKRIRLSRHVITLDSDPPDWKAYILHQHRAAVTYRAATPAGTLGLPLLHTPLLAAAVAVLHPAWWKWAVLILVVRLVSAAWVSRQLCFPIPLLPITAIISATVESAMWCAAWFSRSVWWSGRWRRIGWRGAMVERALRAR